MAEVIRTTSMLSISVIGINSRWKADRNARRYMLFDTSYMLMVGMFLRENQRKYHGHRGSSGSKAEALIKCNGYNRRATGRKIIII